MLQQKGNWSKKSKAIIHADNFRDSLVKADREVKKKIDGMVDF